MPEFALICLKLTDCLFFLLSIGQQIITPLALGPSAKFDGVFRADANAGLALDTAAVPMGL